MYVYRPIMYSHTTASRAFHKSRTSSSFSAVIWPGQIDAVWLLHNQVTRVNDLVETVLDPLMKKVQGHPAEFNHPECFMKCNSCDACMYCMCISLENAVIDCTSKLWPEVFCGKTYLLQNLFLWFNQEYITPECATRIHCSARRNSRITSYYPKIMMSSS